MKILYVTSEANPFAASGGLGDVMGALPSAVAAVVHFGWRALMLMVFCVVVSVACEGVCRQVMKREQTITDGSAALTGLLLAMNLPVTLPLWEAPFSK